MYKAYKAEGLVGKKINKWTILEVSDKKLPCDPSHKLFCCKCECGATFYRTLSAIKQYKSCRKCSGIDRRHNTETICDGIWKTIQRCAESRKHAFEISYEYAQNLIEKQNFICALSGQKITLISSCGNKFREHTASLDRIDSSRGYIEGNVQWVHKDINMMKQKFEQNYFIEVCKMVAKYHESNNEANING